MRTLFLKLYRKLLVLTGCLLILTNGTAFADVQNGLGTKANPNQPSGKTQERKATLNFEDELVEGSTQKPELFYLFQKKNFNYKRLIKLRENFLPEMRKTTEDIQRVRSVN